MRGGSEAGKRHTCWKNGGKADDAPEHDPGPGARWGWIMQILVGGGLCLQGERKTLRAFKGERRRMACVLQKWHPLWCGYWTIVGEDGSWETR